MSCCDCGDIHTCHVPLVHATTDIQMWRRVPADNDMVGSTAHTAIIEASNSFSWRHIPGNLRVIVRKGRQMLSYQEIRIDNGGELVIEDDGEFVGIG